ncbi:MAG: hypothetical protein HY619_00010 [Thaumarchaeota archaeon]|nr:hypothetical protein [Nitrososphaerota archaeon]
MAQETFHIRCPKCGGEANVKSQQNPIRNIIRDHIKCPNCHYERVVERKPEVTLADWLKSAGM